MPLLSAFSKYKELTIERNLSDPAIEGALPHDSIILWGPDRVAFSKEWWDELAARIVQASHPPAANDAEREDRNV